MLRTIRLVDGAMSWPLRGGVCGGVADGFALDAAAVCRERSTAAVRV
jgi:hypothetical protein